MNRARNLCSCTLQGGFKQVFSHTKGQVKNSNVIQMLLPTVVMDFGRGVIIQKIENIPNNTNLIYKKYPSKILYCHKLIFH